MAGILQCKVENKRVNYWQAAVSMNAGRYKRPTKERQHTHAHTRTPIHAHIHKQHAGIETKRKPTRLPTAPSCSLLFTETSTSARFSHFSILHMCTIHALLTQLHTCLHNAMAFARSLSTRALRAHQHYAMLSLLLAEANALELLGRNGCPASHSYTLPHYMRTCAFTDTLQLQ